MIGPLVGTFSLLVISELAQAMPSLPIAKGKGDIALLPKMELDGDKVLFPDFWLQVSMFQEEIQLIEQCFSGVDPQVRKEDRALHLFTSAGLILSESERRVKSGPGVDFSPGKK